MGRGLGVCSDRSANLGLLTDGLMDRYIYKRAGHSDVFIPRLRDVCTDIDEGFGDCDAEGNESLLFTTSDDDPTIVVGGDEEMESGGLGLEVSTQGCWNVSSPFYTLQGAVLSTLMELVGGARWVTWHVLCLNSMAKPLLTELRPLARPHGQFARSKENQSGHIDRTVIRQ